MAHISGGKVTYGRTIKTGDFENKRLDIELAFSVGEGEDFKGMFDLTCRQVLRRFNEMAGTKFDIPDFGDAEEAPAAPAAPQAKTEAPASPKVEAEDKPAAKRGRPPKAKTEAKVEPKDEPEVQDAKDEKKLGEIFADGAMANDPEPDAEISDKELQEACVNRAKVVGPDKVKALRDKTAGKVLKSINELPQTLRPKFIADLKALTA